MSAVEEISKELGHPGDEQARVPLAPRDRWSQCMVLTYTQSGMRKTQELVAYPGDPESFPP